MKKKMEINKIYKESCLETLKKMPNEFIDCVITSPPYWQLRDYGYPEQWGLEPTYEEYLDHLWQLMDEIYRVLKPSGTCWINLGDTYAGNNKNSGLGEVRTTGKNDKTMLSQRRNTGSTKEPNKCLLLIPHRFAIGCIERGWILRNDIIWGKRNAMPESVTDRFSKKHEYIFFMVKSEKYFFDLDSIRDKVKGSSLERYKYNFSGNKLGIERDLVGYVDGQKKHLIPENEKQEQLDFIAKNQYSVVPENERNLIVEKRDLPPQDEIRKFLQEARSQKNITIKQIEEIFENQAPHHWFEKDGSYPSAEDWFKLKDILDFNETYDFQMTNINYISGKKQNNPLGKNCGDVADFWDVTTKPNKSEHFATYNDGLLIKPLLAGCPENGLVYDPFMGSGTTAEGCIRAKRNFIGSELSEMYFKIAEKRVNALLSQPTLF
jgi:DNA modification methylase